MEADTEGQPTGEASRVPAARGLRVGATEVPRPKKTKEHCNAVVPVLSGRGAGGGPGPGGLGAGATEVRKPKKTKSPGIPSFPVLSDEWLDEARKIRAEYE